MSLDELGKFVGGVQEMCRSLLVCFFICSYDCSISVLSNCFDISVFQILQNINIISKPDQKQKQSFLDMKITKFLDI